MTNPDICERAVSELVSIRLVRLASGARSPFDGQWLVEYDPTRPGTAPDGRPLTAHIACSPDPADALRFASVAEAHACWVAESGQPYPADRPLTAFTISIEAASG